MLARANNLDLRIEGFRNQPFSSSPPFFFFFVKILHLIAASGVQFHFGTESNLGGEVPIWTFCTEAEKPKLYLKEYTF